MRSRSLVTRCSAFSCRGTFRAPTPGGQGLALLRDGERVSVPGRGGSGPINIVLQVDGRQFGMVAIDGLNQVARSQGVITLPIRYGAAS